MKRLLAVGCGVARPAVPDHAVIRLDSDPGVAPDVVADMRAIPEDVGQVDVILASHCLEHLRWDEVGPTLTHWRKRLVRDGVLHVRVPDGYQVARQIVFRGVAAVAYQSSMGPVTARSMLYGHEPDVATQPGMRHRTLFDRQTLEAALTGAGFRDVEIEAHPFELRAEAKA